MKNVKIDFYDWRINMLLSSNTLVIEEQEPPILPDQKGNGREVLANPRGMDRISDIVKKGTK